MGSEMSRLALPARGERVGEYTVLAEIASGGMAAVFAVHRSVAGTQQLMAMKLLLPNLAREPRFVEMFLDEAKIAARIQHPNVVPVFDVGTAEGRPFIVMELLHGQTLAALLERSKERPLPTPVVYGILAQVARGLHGAHEALGPDGKRLDVVHRDVSPHNVHVSYDGQVRVVDFGIAVARGRISSTRTGELKGKLAYLAPEQIDRAQVVGPKADLWSFGVLAYEALSGSRPFQGDDEARALWAVLHQAVPSLAERAPGLDPRVVEIVGRCLRRPIEERPASAAELALVFEEADAAAPWAIAAEITRAFAAERERGLGLEREEPAPAPTGTEPTELRDTLIQARRPRAGLRMGLAAGALAIAAVAAWAVLRARSSAPGGAASGASITEPLVAAPPSATPGASPAQPTSAASAAPSPTLPASATSAAPSPALPAPVAAEGHSPSSEPAPKNRPRAAPRRALPRTPPPSAAASPSPTPKPAEPPPLLRNPY